MMVGCEDDIKIYFRDWKMNLREVTMKYGRLVVFVRHDSGGRALSIAITQSSLRGYQQGLGMGSCFELVL
jgi:hypothetical protein